ncbi:hypothetical protein [Aliikangiella coralliicola]|uniref:Tetratricopeptide repeat protein n=1 Tax=Aliikangiella coralliicola TaxID=2592383 RepID=A0A545U8L7_9GAMM|nr:hypothetical protein [Aliikangiella coralliicola]TQV85811.1 hypothetical protein FLL46_17960 [Aliikangiella coralliicola]
MNNLFCKTKILILLLLPLSALASDCEVEYQRHLTTDLELSYEKFDQTMDNGFRHLANAGCYKEAADLIEAYIKHNQLNKNSMRWHVAQLRASAGETDKAIASAKQSLLEKEDFSIEPLRWNDYVKATIAFLEKDKLALKHHRNKVAAGQHEYFGNALNLKLLDALIKHFDQSYLYATSRIE